MQPLTGISPAPRHTTSSGDPPDVVVHVSDLHFGRGFQPVAAERLAAHIAALKPAALVVSGDLTMRARASEFTGAVAYLAPMPMPKVIIPGNHDVPVFDLFTRALFPQRNFLRFTDPLNTNPVVLRHAGILGLNTVTRWMHEKGVLRPRDIAAAREWLASLPPPMWRVLVTHQQLFNVPESRRTGTLLRAVANLRLLAADGAHAVLHGHVHRAHAVRAEEHVTGMPHPVAVIAAGTATCARLRGKGRRVFSFNVLAFSADEMRVTRMDWDFDTADFAPAGDTVFARSAFRA